MLLSGLKMTVFAVLAVGPVTAGKSVEWKGLVPGVPAFASAK